MHVCTAMSVGLEPLPPPHNHASSHFPLFKENVLIKLMVENYFIAFIVYRCLVWPIRCLLFWLVGMFDNNYNIQLAKVTILSTKLRLKVGILPFPKCLFICLFQRHPPLYYVANIVVDIVVCIFKLFVSYLEKFFHARAVFVYTFKPLVYEY